MLAKTMPKNDFLDQLLGLMNEQTADLKKRMRELERKIDANTDVTNETLVQAKHTNGRVTKLEKRMAKVEGTKGRKLNLDPKLLSLLATALVILLAIVASRLGVDIGGVV